jgi:hypothetical protein
MNHKRLLRKVVTLKMDNNSLELIVNRISILVINDL